MLASIGGVRLRNTFEAPKALELYLNLPKESSEHNSVSSDDPLVISKSHVLYKEFYLLKQEIRDDDNRKRIKLEAKKILIDVQKIENDKEIRQMDVVVRNSSPFRCSRKMVVLEDEVQLTDDSEFNKQKIEEQEKILRKRLIEKTFDDPETRKELYIARYIKKSAKAFGATQGQIFHDNFTVIPANHQILDQSDELRLRNFIIQNNDLCLIKGDFNKYKDLSMNASIQKANEKIKMNIHEIKKIDEIICSQQEREEWFIGFKEQHETKPISAQDGLLYDMAHSKNGQKKPEMIVCVTVYNETAEELAETLNGIAENAERFLDYGIDPRELMVVIIFDGIKAIHESVIDWLDIMLDVNNQGENPVRSVINQVFPDGRDVKNHVWPVHVSRDNSTVCQFTYKKNFVCDKKKTIYLNTLFVAKHANAQKLSSHVWFFQGFCRYYNPKYCVLLDCGTIPDEVALLNYYLAFESDKQVGGCCGYMSVSNATIFGIEGAQLFEYTFAHILDKALEGLTGFIHVLPGAFSAYRWDAINDQEIFKNYFKVIELKDPQPPKIKDFKITRCCEYNFNKTKNEDKFEKYMKNSMTCKEKNMYLAEDRIFCLDIYCRKNKNYILKYVPDSRAVTDVMQNLVRLLSQRRRWINGSWFAFLYNWKNMSKVLKSKHNYFRVCLFYLSMIYMGIQTVITYVLISIYYVVAKIVIKEFIAPGYGHPPWKNVLVSTLQYSLLLLYYSLFIYSLHFKSQEAKSFFKFTAAALGIINVMSFMSVLFFVFGVFGRVLRNQALMDNQDLINVAYTGIVSLVLHILVVIFTGTAPDLIKGLISFIIYAPSYINTMFIYSFCNIDDVSWGTRQDNDNSSQTEKEAYKQYKLSYLVPWIGINLFLGQILSYMSVTEKFRIEFIVALAYFSAAVTFIKIILAIAFYFKYSLYDRFWLGKTRRKLQSNRQQIEKDYMNYVKQIRDKIQEQAKQSILIASIRQKSGVIQQDVNLLKQLTSVPNGGGQSLKFQDANVKSEYQDDFEEAEDEFSNNENLKKFKSVDSEYL